jgi:Tfp pilus assembly protein PilF
MRPMSIGDRAFPLLLAAVLSSAAAGCAKSGATSGAQVPPGATVSGGATGGPGVVTSPTGEQYAVTDAPTSGEAANRPKMNASAAQAYGAGMQAFQAGDLEGAKAQFQKATEADPNAYQAHYSLGVVRERLNETSGALSSYSRASTVVRDYEPAIAAYGVLLARSNRTSEAESYLEERQGAMPRSAAVTAALAEVKSIKNDSATAQRLAQEALKKNPDYRPAMVTIARDHYRTRRLDLSLYTLKAVLDGYGTENPPRDKNNAEARLIRGLIYKEQGQRKLAIDDLQAALGLRPDLVEARIHLAAYNLEAGNAGPAVQLLEGALRYDKNHVIARLNLGDAYRLQGKAAEAKRELDWVANKDPSLAQVHYNLGLLFLFSENVPGLSPKQAADRAIDEFEQYKRMKPRSQGGVPDDTDELITRAKTKRALIDAKEQEKAMPAAAKPAAAPAGKPGPAAPAAKPGAAPPAPPPAPAGKPGTGAMPPAPAAPPAKPGTPAPAPAPAKPPSK